MTSETVHESAPARPRRAPWWVGTAAGVGAVVGGYALLEPRAPGNMAAGFLAGGLTVIALMAVDRWRVHRGSRRVGPAARWAAGVPDERDDRLLTRSLAVTGLVSIVGTSAAVIAHALGANPEVAFMPLPLVLIGALGITFAALCRRD